MTKIHNNHHRSHTAMHLLRSLFLPMIAAVMSAAGLSSCIDEIEMGDGYIPEGETTVLMNVSFSPLVTQELNGAESRSTTDLSGSIAPTGDRMDQISSLYLLFYSNSGNLVRSEQVDLDKHKPELEDRNNTDATDVNDPDGAVAAQDQTYCVKNIPLTLQNGLYRIFAVANIADFLTEYSEEIQTIESLRDIKLNWIGNNISRNSEMFGYFTNGKSDTRSLDFEKEAVVTVKPDRNDLHAWIRRAVSKLTIDFDGSGLRDNVSVYIKEARVYDIASGAYLGHYSCVGEVPARKDATPVKGGFDLYAEGSAHVLRYGTGDEPNDWPLVTKKQNLTTYTDSKGQQQSLHSELALCLPFYENMQGGDGTVLKYQDADGDGKVDYPNAGEYEGEGNNRVWKHEEAKDRKPNGTYVEVVGYYESKNSDYTGRGDIKYRFMLGKNVRDNFDCERNHHYKLTLAFKGNGNDADWHIEYNEMKPIELPNPIYISYLYNKSLTFPITINTGGRTLKSLEIEVTKSNWAPYFNDEAPDLKYYDEADKLGDYGKKHPEVGFLSLVRTHVTRIPKGDGADYVQQNRVYFDQAISDKTDNLTITRRKRKYLVTPGTHGDEANGQYTVTKEGNVFEFEIPLYTRAKNLIKDSAYTGNNPFVGYPREAEITVYAYYEGLDDPVVTTTPVFQVRRLVNPKGIFRKSDNDASFKVTLMELKKETSTSFDPIQSVGPWKAYVLSKDAGFIDLDGKQEVYGDALSNIEFNVNFNGTIKPDENRFAIIEVLYHSYSCVHQIYVRQGDAPVQLFDDKTNNKSVYWHTYNMRTKNDEVDNAVDEGSLFRFGKWDYPIDAINNVYTHKKYWVNIDENDFIAPKQPFTLAGGGTANWTAIGSSGKTGSFADQKDAAGNVYSLPTAMEFTILRDATEQAYGVLYGDKATSVKTDLNEVYCYQHSSASGSEEDDDAKLSYGMRGCFAYINDPNNKYYGRFVFFPIGASGYGQRKQRQKEGEWGAETIDAVLRYAAGRQGPYLNPSDPLKLPLFYDIYKRPGAIYWAQKVGNAKDIENNKTISDAIGLDINYYTFDFNYIQTSNLIKTYNNQELSNACFIRCVTRK